MVAARSTFNNTIICTWTKSFSPLLEKQIFVSSLMSVITFILLKPLRIPVMVSQIIAGILLGPSFIGRSEAFTREFFPPKSYLLLETYSNFGLVFQVFLIGVQIAPWTILKVGRKAFVIGLSVVLVPLTLSIATSIILAAKVDTHHAINRSLLRVGAAQSMTSFPVIASYLYELNIINSDFSRVAFSSSMISGVLCFFLVVTVLFYEITRDTQIFVMGLIMYAVALAIIMFLMRPLVRWMNTKIPEGKARKNEYVLAVFIMVLVLAFICSLANKLFGPFVFGMVIPSGPPLGSAVVERLEVFITWTFLPIFYTKHGLMMNIFDVNLKGALLVELVILVSCAGKFLGAFLPALYYHMPFKDAVLLGLTMNAQGFVEIWFFTLLLEKELIDRESYEIMSVSMIIVTGALTPLVRRLHKSSMEYKLDNRRTIQHSGPKTELRILAAVYDQENIPTLIHLLKASNPTKDHPVNITVIHFIELVGRAVPVVISHKVQRNLPYSTAASRHIINMLRHYEESNKGKVSMHPFTVVSSYGSMHNDVYMLSLQNWTSLIILPYHKNLATGIVNGGIRTVNCNVLDRAPCSVGIIIDRGLLDGNKFDFRNWTSYNVALVFLGGADDREALALGGRMAGYSTIQLTVFRFLTRYCNTASDAMVLDDEMVSEFKLQTQFNHRVTFIEEQVDNGLGVIEVIEDMKDRYDLILLGRRHDQDSPLIVELTEWTRCSELGTIGDIFTMSGYGGKATIFVIQQQSKVAKRSRFSWIDENLVHVC
ncbi:hypothetical protein ACHQM5_010392 [Ranunculus cassubicifolius]